MTSSIAARLGALENQPTQKFGLSREKLREVFDLMRSDESAVDLLRGSCVLESAGMYRPRPGTPQEVLDVFERLGIAELVQTDDGRREAVKLLRDQAHGRQQRALAEKFGERVVLHFFPEGGQA